MKVIIKSSSRNFTLKFPTFFLKSKFLVKRFLKGKYIEQEKRKIILSLLPKIYKKLIEYKKENRNINIVEVISKDDSIIIQI